MAPQESGAGGRPRDRPCAQSVLGFFFNKGARGGPKIFLNLAAVLFVLLLVAKLVPQRVTETALASMPHDLWPGKVQESGREPEIEEDEGTPGGLRLVVFGENDIATPAGKYPEVEDSKTWTQALCAELQCTKHISMAPPPDSVLWSVSSKALYAQGVEGVLNETAPNSHPGMDYSYLSTHYAPKWQSLDLKDQVDRFLAMPKPRHAPNDTLWVFNFGFWDVWSLSALPIPAGKHSVDAMTKDMFEQIERLYEASTDPGSIAWSDFNYVPPPPQPESSPEGEDAGDERPAGGPTEKRDDQDAEGGPGVENSPADPHVYFRLLIPRVTDPSLLPGWRDLRAQLPKVHSKAEQMRNSAELTEHWNDRIVDGLVKWVRKENKMSGEENTESEGPDPEAQPDALAKPTSQAKPTGPLRDGYAFNLANYVLDAMVGRQLRNAGIRDASGRGDAPVEQGFRDVAHSCVEPVGTALVATSPQSSIRLAVPYENTGGDVQVPSAAAAPHDQQQQQAGRARRGTGGGGGGDMASVLSGAVRVCHIPGDYLFYTPFALSQRAIGEIAAQTAQMIRNNETIRGKIQAQMEEQNQGS